MFTHRESDNFKLTRKKGETAGKVETKGIKKRGRGFDKGFGL